MLVSLLLCQRMEDNEVVFLIGCERFSNYDGYADSFRYAGDYQDQSPRWDCPRTVLWYQWVAYFRDNWGRRATHLVAIDAVDYRDRRQQYEERFIFRELRKAYTGFMPSDPADREPGCPVITGNWGCGAFNGDRQLKGTVNKRILLSLWHRSLLFCSSDSTHCGIASETPVNVCCLWRSTASTRLQWHLQLSAR